MLINNNGINTNTSSGKPKELDAGGSKANVAKEAPPSRDSVELSDQGQKLARMEAKLASVDEVDTVKVESIRQAIESGTYEINPQRIAEKLLDSDQLS